MKINNLVSFEIEKGTSKKGNDFIAVILVIGTVKKYIGYLNNSEYDTIQKLLSEKKGE